MNKEILPEIDRVEKRDLSDLTKTFWAGTTVIYVRWAHILARHYAHQNPPSDAIQFEQTAFPNADLLWDYLALVITDIIAKRLMDPVDRLDPAFRQRNGRYIMSFYNPLTWEKYSLVFEMIKMGAEMSWRVITFFPTGYFHPGKWGGGPRHDELLRVGPSKAVMGSVKAAVAGSSKPKAVATSAKLKVVAGSSKPKAVATSAKPKVVAGSSKPKYSAFIGAPKVFCIERDGSFISLRDDDKKSVATAKRCGESEQFEMVTVDDGKVALRSIQYGSYLSMFPNGEFKSMPHNYGREHFFMEKNGDGRVAFKSAMFDEYIGLDDGKWVGMVRRYVTLVPASETSKPKSVAAAGTPKVFCIERDGSYISLRNDAKKSVATADGCGESEQFEMVTVDDGKVALRSIKYGSFLSMFPRGEFKSMPHNYGREHFFMEKNGDGRVAFKSAMFDEYIGLDDGKWVGMVRRYVTLVPTSGTSKPKSVAAAGTPKVFCIERDGSYVSLRNDAEKSVVTADGCGESEQFEMVAVDGGKVALRSIKHGSYLSMFPNGEFKSMPHNYGREHFFMEKNGDGRVAFKSAMFDEYIGLSDGKWTGMVRRYVSLVPAN